MTAEWAFIPLLPEYEASYRNGQIRHRTTKQFLPITGNKKLLNRYQVKIDKRTYLIHRLVYSAFTGTKPSGDDFIHHKDGDEFNNDFENLECCSCGMHSKKHRKSKKLSEVMP